MEITTKADFKNNMDQYINQVYNDVETLIVNSEESKNVVFAYNCCQLKKYPTK